MAEAQSRFIVMPSGSLAAGRRAGELGLVRESYKSKVKHPRYNNVREWMSDSCKAVLLERLERDGQVDVHALRDELARSHAPYFNPLIFDEACQTVRDHCDLSKPIFSDD